MLAQIVVIWQLVDHLLDLVLLEAAHESESATLKRNDGRGLLGELLGSVQDGAISSNCDDEIDFLFWSIFYEQTVMSLMDGFDWLLLHFGEGFLVKKVEVDTDGVR